MRYLAPAPGWSSTIPNWFAYVALFSWPAVCVVLFVMLPVEAAAIWSLVGGLMLLPSGMQVDFPLLPPLDKTSIPAISTLLLCWMKGTPTRAPRQSLLVYLLAAGYVLSPMLTSLGNSYELQTAKESIPGFYPLDGLKYAGRNLITLAPFYVGSRILYTQQGRMLLLRALPAAMLVYSLPMLFELRMSPQLHTWVYGYFPNDAFSQQMRGSGFRPVVFFQHGLALAFFTSLTLIAALVLIRTRTRIFQVAAAPVAGYLSVLLLLCKSLGPLAYAVLVAPIVLFTRPRMWVMVAFPILLMVCAYPALRGNNLAPTQVISSLANQISPERSASFRVRVVNEEMLLWKANQKPAFGWGTWGRNRVYERDTGKDISVTDGGWIIQFGVFGWFGYLTLFGLFAAVGFQVVRAIDSKITPANVTLAGLTLILAIYVADQVPNANPLSLTFLIAGAVGTAARARAATSTRPKFVRAAASGAMTAAADLNRQSGNVVA